MQIRNVFLIAALIMVAGCETAYYETAEKLGFHKRDILIDRIESAQEAQEEGQEQFKSALEQFQAVVNFDGGELQDVYEKLNDEYEDSVDAAETITDRIDSVESVANALFDEWQEELGEYSNERYRRDSERQLKETQRRYNRLVASMRKAERSIEPVLTTLKDNVLFLKHNLNARAIASLKNELGTVNKDVANLVATMQSAIDESNAFIAELRQDQG
jgi:chromosome segregation ATPase